MHTDSDCRILDGGTAVIVDSDFKFFCIGTISQIGDAPKKTVIRNVVTIVFRADAYLSVSEFGNIRLYSLNFRFVSFCVVVLQRIFNILFDPSIAADICISLSIIKRFFQGTARSTHDFLSFQ